ncbi:MAG: protein kinase [Steroidobacteraceae bacterium]|jgi:tRNA isopentenyl-2-thiomethyl-A-37 hydroxylase MiaE/CheY-like chemotaxis protein|nr:protein kinase [Steroidobacteraceae bacterium]
MSLRVLIIDDEPIYRKLLAQHIATGFEGPLVSEFDPAGFEDPPQVMPAQPCDVVLLDDTPGAGAGLEWLRDLSQRPGFPPVVYLLSARTADAEAEALAAGAHACLSKRRIAHQRLVEALRSAQAARRQAIELAEGGRDEKWDSRSRFGEHVIRGYHFVRKLAQSPMASVFVGRKAATGEEVVLKVLRYAPDAGARGETFDRFLREYQIASALRHPKVAHIFDFGASDDYAFIAMEYFRCGDLRARMRGGLGPSEALHLLRDMAEALRVLHDAGVLHRDLKPGNVMLREDGSVALIDFGMAKQLDIDAGLTMGGEIFGTPYYMSPEQGHGRDTDARSDLYSLGVIFFEMLTGRKPYGADTPMKVIWQHAHAPLPGLPAELGHLEALLHRCLAKDPADRFGSAAKLLEAIEALERPAPVPAPRRLSEAASPLELLLAPTPPAWFDAAAAHRDALLVDHANCEKKAASSALALMFAYADDMMLARQLSRLAREELRHFEQVQRHMELLGVPVARQRPGRYAEGLRRATASGEPGRRLDLLLCGALIEARSCERFAGLWPRLDEPLATFYRGLEASESRHFRVYLDLARDYAAAAGLEIEPRLAALAAVEAGLATSPDTEFRFHSGPPA